MKEKTLTFTRRKQRKYWRTDPTEYRYIATDKDVTMCEKELLQKLDIPKGTKKIVAVFSTERVPGAFTLTKARNATGLYSTGQSNIKEFRANLMIEVRWYMGKQYNAGYRYVRIEY